MIDDDDALARLTAVEAWLAAIKKMTVVGDMRWETGWADLRRIAVNYIIRRQLDALDATVMLARNNLGHLTVGFVRPALDELLWLSWVKDLPIEKSQQLLMLMGSSDAIRSILAQRNYVGDPVMQELWYPVGFLEALASKEEGYKSAITALGKELDWRGNPLPTARWVAKQSGHELLFEYLHAAASRALHFSMGEVMRNGWGEPGGKLITDKAEFRQYRTDFALYQLPLLFLETSVASGAFLADAGVIENYDESIVAEVASTVKAMAKLGRVPLVHAHEWNLTPEGPLPHPKRS